MTFDGAASYSCSSENMMAAGGAAAYGFDPLQRLARHEAASAPGGVSIAAAK